MNSFNHYAYGAIGDWMYRNITGLDCYDDGVGYKKIIIRPHPGGNLEYARASLETGYGKLTVQWKITSGKILMDVEVPANTTATIYLPTTNSKEVLENGKPFRRRKGNTDHQEDQGII